MTDATHQESFDDSRQLDRLVDGELDDAARRELLLSLEKDPQGWRRCALAFLEAQTWSGELANVARGVPASEPASPVSYPMQRYVRGGGMVFSIAASFFVALGLGYGVANYRSGGSASTGMAGAPAPSTGAVAHVGAPGGGPTTGEMPRTIDPSDETRGYDVLLPPRLPGDGAVTLASDQEMITPQMMRMLERAGHQIQRRRSMVPVVGEDGRRALVPIDQIEILYTGNQYQ